VLHGTRSFTTENGVLLDLWNHSIRDVVVSDDEHGKKTWTIFLPVQDTGSSNDAEIKNPRG
jgi:hypothetical protein